MKIFGKYFAYHAKKSLGRFAVIAVLTLIFIIPWFMQDNDWLAEKLNVVTFTVCLLCTVMPVIEFSGFHNRKNADTMFSMSISRTKLALAHYLNGAWQILALFSVYVLFYIGAVELCKEQVFVVFDMSLFVPYYFATVLSCIFLYSFFVLVFNVANNIPDGIVFMFFYIFAGFIFKYAILTFDFDLDISLVSTSAEIPYFYTVNVASEFMNALWYGQEWQLKCPEGWLFNEMIVPMIICGVRVAVLVLCLCLLLARKKAEKIGAVSDSVFGYALLIPVYAISLSFIVIEVMSFVNETIVWPLIIVATVIAYMVYRRSFKLKIPDYITIAVICILILASYPFGGVVAC